MKKLEIRKTIIRERELMYIVIITIYISLELKKPELWLLIPISILLFLISLIIKRLIDRKPQLIIDEKGIYYSKKRVNYLWNKIEDVEVKYYSGDFLQLNIKSKSLLSSIDLKNINSSPKEIEDAIVFFSDGKIKSEKEKFKNQINNVLNDNQNIEIIASLFQKHKRKSSWLNALIFFGILAISIFLQIKFIFPYSFAFGWLTILLGLYSFNKKAELKLRQSEYIKKLTENQFNEIAIKYELRIRDDKNKKRLGYIAMFIITVGIFVASFFVNR